MIRFPYVPDPDNGFLEPVIPIKIRTAFDAKVYDKLALIDSGSQVSCIPPTLINELNISPINDDQVGLSGIAGSRDSFQYTINLVFDGQEIKGEIFYDMHQDAGEYIIIGLDIMSKYTICLNGKQNITTINP